MAKRKYNFTRLMIDGNVILRPNCPEAFLQPGMTVHGYYRSSLLAAYMAGHKYYVERETFSEHWLN